ncbi:MAG: hypothetical protein V1813_02175 [Candidatus Aenigmatarchaeota archaeon]
MKLDRKFVFSLFVAVMMVTWAIGMAVSYNIKTTPQGVKIEKVYDRLLTGTEKITILKSGYVLIEYLYVMNPETLDRKAMYENFAARFSDVVVLEAVAISAGNQTMDQMIAPDGDVIPLDNVTASNLVDVFCDNSVVQPRECILRNI